MEESFEQIVGRINPCQIKIKAATEPSPPGTGFLAAETGPPKSPPETTDFPRDQKGPEPMAEIPAQTAYLDLVENYRVWKDWMVGAPGLEPGTR
jgi:hypothetical protein